MTRTIAFVALGANLGHPRRQIGRAARRLAALPRTRLLRLSSNYVTEPIGAAQPQPDYVNAVAMLATALPPHRLLARLLAIERKAGRRRDPRGPRNAPRSLDLDLLLYGRLRLAHSALTLPHPRMHERAFVLRPLVEIAPSVSIPRRGLARRLLRPLRGQRVARTRTHALP